ncbi:MAG TPA: multidrug effflux MFS transporter [Streptosporangiaceae bacterium]|nr:multidrug effflux MFS transporter [Streptosporangiaceae bacterium]
MIRPRVAAPSFVALMLITGTTALSTDTYIAALPQVQRTLGTSSSVAQLTMTACIAGMAVGQLATGPVSDARGRRSLIVAATLTFAATSVLCALAFSGWELIAARAVQGIACGAAAAVGRAVVTDTWTGREAAAKFGSLSAIGLIAPVIGPAVGGALLTVGTWRTIFWFLALVGVAMTAGAVAGLPETLPPPQRHPGGLGRLLSRARQLLANRAFATPVLVQCLTTGGFFIYIGGSSFVLQQGLGISQGLYSVVFAANAGAMMLSSVAFRLLVMRRGPVLLRRWAIIVQTTAVTALFMVALACRHQPPLAAVWICLGGMTIGLGAYLPANSSITQAAGRRYAGTASALGGGAPFLVGSGATPLTGLIGSESVRTMATAMFAFFAVAATAAVLTSRRPPAAETRNHDRGPVAAQEAATKEPIP